MQRSSRTFGKWGNGTWLMLTRLGVTALTAWIGLPYLLAQVLNLGIVREGQRGEWEVALTFDDGPDPDTTPAVLDALDAAKAQATFFVLAGKAEAHPELIRRMLESGHQVEAHAARHVHAWIRSPWGAILDPLRAVRRVAAVTGHPVHFHRPPHGAYTLGTLLGQRLAGVTGAHWSLEGQDWRADLSPAQVSERLQAQIFPGAVVVLHDAGPGARNTVPLLPELLAQLQERGYRLSVLSELPGVAPLSLRNLPRRALIALDMVFDRIGGIRHAGSRADNLFRIGVSPFPLEMINLADGVVLRKGMPALEFHVNNPQMVDGGLKRSIRRARIDLQAVASDLLTLAEYREAQAVYCLSGVSPLLRILGFETHDLPPVMSRRLGVWARVLRFAYGSDPGDPKPKLSVLSREAFLTKYTEQGA